MGHSHHEDDGSTDEPQRQRLVLDYPDGRHEVERVRHEVGDRQATAEHDLSEHPVATADPSTGPGESGSDRVARRHAQGHPEDSKLVDDEEGDAGDERYDAQPAQPVRPHSGLEFEERGRFARRSSCRPILGGIPRAARGRSGFLQRAQACLEAGDPLLQRQRTRLSRSHLPRVASL